MNTITTLLLADILHEDRLRDAEREHRRRLALEVRPPTRDLSRRLMRSVATMIRRNPATASGPSVDGAARGPLPLTSR